MNANAKSTWVDPDDAPELTDEMLAKGKRLVGGKEVNAQEFQAAVKKRMGRPPVDVKRPTLNMRVDADVLDALKASGKGWQTRVNSILRKEVLGKQA